MTTTTSEGERTAAARELLSSLMGVKTWLRESQQWLYGSYSPASLMVLAMLDREGSSRVSELAEIARVDPSVVSRQLAHLEHCGLVERSADPADGRAHRVSLSSEGSSVLEQGRTHLAARVEERLRDWAPEDIRSFATDLSRLLGALTTRPSDVPQT